MTMGKTKGGDMYAFTRLVSALIKAVNHGRHQRPSS